MSHITKYELKITDTDMLKSVIEDLNATENFRCEILGNCEFQTYSKKTNGFQFKLAGWHYPVCVNGEGNLEFDNYHGNWGDEALLDKVIQAYQKAVILKRARQQGWQVSMATADNGDVTLRLMQ